MFFSFKMKPNKFYTIIAVFLLLGNSSMASDNNISDKLKGTWIETMQNKDYPGIILEFKENKIFKSLYFSFLIY